MVEVPLDKLPAPLVAHIHRDGFQVAYHLPDKDRYIVEQELAGGQRQELEYDVGRGRLLTLDERRAELPSPTHTQLADDNLAMTTSYSIDDVIQDKRVTFSTDDGNISVSRAVHVPLVWDGAQLIRAALRQHREPARYAAMTHDEKIAHWTGVLHRYRRARGESGRDEDDVFTAQLVTDLERSEPKLRALLREILTELARMEQTAPADMIARFTRRTGITVP